MLSQTWRADMRCLIRLFITHGWLWWLSYQKLFPFKFTCRPPTFTNEYKNANPLRGPDSDRWRWRGWRDTMQILGTPLKNILSNWAYAKQGRLEEREMQFFFLLSLVISSGQVGEVTDGRTGWETDCIRSEIVYLARSLWNVTVSH